MNSRGFYLTNGNLDARTFEWAVLTTLWGKDVWNLTLVHYSDRIFLAGKESEEFGEEVKRLIRAECATKQQF